MRPDDFPKLIPMQLFKKIMCDGFNNNKGFSLIKIDIINLEYLKSIHGNSIIRLIHMAILDILNENTRKTDIISQSNNNNFILYVINVSQMKTDSISPRLKGLIENIVFKINREIFFVKVNIAINNYTYRNSSLHQLAKT